MAAVNATDLKTNLRYRKTRALLIQAIVGNPSNFAADNLFSACYCHQPRSVERFCPCHVVLFLLTLYRRHGEGVRVCPAAMRVTSATHRYDCCLSSSTILLQWHVPTLAEFGDHQTV